VIARVVPDIVGIDRRFDYVVPENLRDRVRVGTIVRVPLHGRRVRGWVVEVAEAPETDRPLLPLAKVTGWGPPGDLVELTFWAAWRWAGHPTHFLGTASPPGAVAALPGTPPAGAPRLPGDGPATDIGEQALRHPVSVVRMPPAASSFAVVVAAVRRGDTLVLAPTSADAAAVAADLRRSGYPVAALPREWARAAAGGCTVVGARAAAWAPVPALAAVVVLDEHDEAYQEERAPTWNAREVAIERARRRQVPCVLVSPCPSLEALATGAPVLVPSRNVERTGWPLLEVVDRRGEPRGHGLYSERVVEVVRAAGSATRVVCVLNRKGRARLLGCASCGELVRCERCDGAMETAADGLRCRRCGAARPVVCLTCGTTRLKVLRVGVSRVRDELELLAGQPVAEVTADAADRPPPDAAVVVGTEAVLYRVQGARTVVFLDFDQELLALRYRAGEEALALLARAARLVSGRQTGGRLVVQTRLPTHEVLDAVMHADPSRLSVVEAARRAALRLPPETALARISGPATPDLVAELGAQDGIEVLGPSNDRWLARAEDHRALCDALASVRRPPGRVRIEVDPLRA
jgi:primosomal protein N' (replication factor Y)